MVRVKEKISFGAAVEWVLKHANILPEKVYARQDNGYIGPVPQGWINYWHNNLPDHAREYYHARLLTDETIKSHKLGWRPDYAAYTIPFWRGALGNSEIDTFQYRESKLKEQKSKYWGEKGYVRPAILNIDLLTSSLEGAIFFFGSFDGILGRQDGLSVFGVNGASAFVNPKRAESVWLKRTFEHVPYKYIVPDAQHVEFEAAHKLAHMIGAQVRYFPRSLGTKDYNDFRLAGYTPEYFIEEVLQVAIKDGYVFGVSQANIIHVSDVLGLMSQGQADQALQLLNFIAEKYKHSGGLMSHSFQQMCNHRPLQYDESTFTDDEWDKLATEFSNAQTYTKQEEVIRCWSEIALNRMGAF